MCEISDISLEKLETFVRVALKDLIREDAKNTLAHFTKKPEKFRFVLDDHQKMVQH